MTATVTTNPTNRADLIKALGPLGAKTTERLEELFTWLDQTIGTSQGGAPQKLDATQETQAVNYLRSMFVAKGLMKGDSGEAPVTPNMEWLSEKQKTELEQLTDSVIDTGFSGVFNDLIKNFPQANPGETIQSIQTIIQALSKDGAEPTLSIQDLKGSSEATLSLEDLKAKLQNLNSESKAALQTHLKTTLEVIRGNPGLLAVQKLNAQGIEAFIKAAYQSSNGDPSSKTTAETQKIFNTIRDPIQKMIEQATRLSKLNPRFDAIAFYQPKLEKLDIPSQVMKEILHTIEQHHKTTEPEATNKSKSLIGNIASELMESMPYLLAQNLIGFCSSLVAWIPIIGQPLAGIVHSSASIFTQRAMGRAMTNPSLAKGSVA